MNQSFIKMLCFEWKANFTNWIFNLTIAFCVLCMYLYTLIVTSNPSVLIDIYVPIFIFLTWLFTLLSYQESTNTQSMQMYHLLSVSRNIKFLSKQFITFLAFPLLLIIVTYLFVSIINIFNLAKEHLEIFPQNDKNIIWFGLWILGHSFSTLLAIIFKKNKILYALLVYSVTRIVFGIVVLILVFAFRSIGFMNSIHFSDDSELWGILGLTGILSMAVLFYGISYHLFFRRQL